MRLKIKYDAMLFAPKDCPCQLCSNGSCRIIPDKIERGVCGIDGDGLVMRNMVHKLNMGIAAYTYHCKEAAQTLKATALGKTPFSLKDVDKLDKLAVGDEPGQAVDGIEAHINKKRTALRI
ncbi:MAG TPA: hypothetical protein DHV84_00905 [Desulfotomaculum sp.]|jgi:carbon-monoxide dehydrogenase catalytic subunit|nr:hypothetical protein [Desulfotomaculum sp.]